MKLCLALLFAFAVPCLAGSGDVVTTVPSDRVLFINSLDTTETVLASDSAGGPWDSAYRLRADESVEVQALKYAKIKGEADVYEITGGRKYFIKVSGGKKVLKKI